MSALTLLLTVWGVLTAILVVLLIYRSTLTMREDDQLFLDQSESHMEKEQQELIIRLNKISVPVRLLGGASGLLILVIAGLWLYEGLTRVQ
jgi:Tfp pilus assembly protein PilN